MRRWGLFAGAAGAAMAAATAARNDYQTREELSGTTQALIWPAYALGGALLIDNLRESQQNGTHLSRTLGGVVSVAGAAAILAGTRRFQSFSQLAGRESGDLITDGMYTRSRNPQYLGIVLLAFGSAIAARSLSGLTFAAIAMAGYSWYVPAEEAHLSRIFGRRYSEYRGRVSRWWGHPRRPGDRGRRLRGSRAARRCPRGAVRSGESRIVRRHPDDG